MDQASFDWKSGTIAFWDLDQIDEASPVSEQIDHLKEDLAQITYPGGIVLDLGWYPSFDLQGEFKVTVVQNDDWESPIFQAGAKDFRALKYQTLLAISSSV